MIAVTEGARSMELYSRTHCFASFVAFYFCNVLHVERACSLGLPGSKGPGGSQSRLRRTSAHHSNSKTLFGSMVLVEKKKRGISDN